MQRVSFEYAPHNSEAEVDHWYREGRRARAEAFTSAARWVLRQIRIGSR